MRLSRILGGRPILDCCLDSRSVQCVGSHLGQSVRLGRRRGVRSPILRQLPIRTLIGSGMGDKSFRPAFNVQFASDADALVIDDVNVTNEDNAP